MKTSNLYKLAIFASGSGTNAENIIEYFKRNPTVEVSIILSNKPDAYVLERAQKHKVKTHVFSRESFYKSREVLHLLQKEQIDLIVLAGFLWLIPEYLIDAFDNRIINIHPALLPQYGGKGMFGKHVHEAVIANKESESGITIHYVNNRYDEGKIIFQDKVQLTKDDTPDSLAKKIHVLEYKHYPQIIELLLSKLNN